MTPVTLPCQFCGTMNRIDPAKFDKGPKCAECGRPFLLDRPITVTEEQFDTAAEYSEEDYKANPDAVLLKTTS